jgi:hypothetical protein
MEFRERFLKAGPEPAAKMVEGDSGVLIEGAELRCCSAGRSLRGLRLNDESIDGEVGGGNE